MYSIQRASQSVKMSNGHYGQARQYANAVAEEEETSFEEILAKETKNPCRDRDNVKHLLIILYRYYITERVDNQ